MEKEWLYESDWDVELELRRQQHTHRLIHLTKEQAVHRLAGFLAAAELMAENNAHIRLAKSELIDAIEIDADATVQVINRSNSDADEKIDPYRMVAKSYAAGIKGGAKKLAVSGAVAKHANDAKQADKVLVRECWDDWQKQPDRYDGKAAFARDMLDKFENLKSQPVIEGWCRVWERET
jgi:hypothetical protein